MLWVLLVILLLVLLVLLLVLLLLVLLLVVVVVLLLLLLVLLLLVVLLLLGLQRLWMQGEGREDTCTSTSTLVWDFLLVTNFLSYFSVLVTSVFIDTTTEHRRGRA